MPLIALRRLYPALLIFALALLALRGAQWSEQQREARRQEAARLAQQIAQRAAGIALLSQEEVRGLRTYRNAAHLREAAHLGQEPAPTRADVDTLVAAGRLRPLSETPLYTVQPMRYGAPVVLPETHTMLALVGSRFRQALAAEGLPPCAFVVTSAMRTLEDQRRLRRVNGNAAATSSHTYGATVDLHTRRFDCAPGAPPTWPAVSLREQSLRGAYRRLGEDYPSRLGAVLGRTLLEMQREGLLMAIYEQRQPVYHVTVQRPESRRS